MFHITPLAGHFAGFRDRFRAARPAAFGFG
jgi:hypothetical protein